MCANQIQELLLMMVVMRATAELALLEVAVVGEGMFFVRGVFSLSGCGCEAAASRLRVMMKMKAVLRALYLMARLGLQRQLGVVVVGYCGAQPIRGPCAAAADAYYSVRDVYILT